MDARDKKRGPQPIGEILHEFLREKERDAVDPRQRVVRAWSAAIADDPAPGTRVTTFRKGIVTIEVKSPPLCAELSQFRRRDLLSRMQRSMGDGVIVKDLRFRLGSW